MNSVTRGKCGPWNEYVDINKAWFFNFQLTLSGKLPQNVKERIDEYNLYKGNIITNLAFILCRLKIVFSFFAGYNWKTNV